MESYCLSFVIDLDSLNGFILVIFHTLDFIPISSTEWLLLLAFIPNWELDASLNYEI